MIFLMFYGDTFIQNTLYKTSQSTPTKTKISPSLTPLPTLQSVSSSANIKVSAPHSNQTVGRDFVLKGQARVFENVVSIEVKSATSSALYLAANTMTNASDAGVFGDFVYTVHLPPTLTSEEKLLLEVFQSSPKDGSHINKVIIPLAFKKQ